MTGTASVSRSHLMIFGLCLPLAVFLGYLVAEPRETSTFIFVALVLGTISIPIVMKWHQMMVLFSVNAIILPYFLPGRPPLWMVTALVSMLMMVMNRALSQPINFFRDKNVSRSLIFLAIVVVATAYANGVSFGSMGGEASGGKRYVMILAASFIYLSLSTMDIPFEKVTRYLSIYFLSSLTTLMGYVALLAGPTAASYMVSLFPVETEFYQSYSIAADVTGSTFTRLGSLSSAALGLLGLMLSIYGIRGVMEYRRPWRFLLFVAAIAAGFFSGFRSNLILCFMILGLVFYFEGLIKSWYFFGLASVTACAVFVLASYSDKLPTSVQRGICFLPVKVDLNVRADADASTQWRLDLWQQVLPTIPMYLIKGRGYGIDQRETELLHQAMENGSASSAQYYIATGDFHSGPLSVIIPLGIFGAIGFLWFSWAGYSVLRRNYKYGDLRLKRVNTFLLSYYIAQFVGFIFIFGSLYSGFIVFTATVGLSVGLNHGVAEAPTRAPGGQQFKSMRKMTI